MNNSIAVIIPCYNEDKTIAKVITDSQNAIPAIRIYVFDNNSTDKTTKIARSLGAVVMKEKRQGKGYVVQSMFKKVDADIYIMVDGDDTYDLRNLKPMVSLIINEEADIVVGNRFTNYNSASFRPLHTVGNKLVRTLTNKLFHANLHDIMSGLRVMSKRFVKTVNIMATGFEVETEMTIKALKYDFTIIEVPVGYRERPIGSVSKLNTITDGMRVIRTIFIIFKEYRPFLFFTVISLVFLLLSLSSGYVVIKEFLQTRYITHVPLSIFASGTMILSIISFVTGVILDSVNRRFDELYNYLRGRSDFYGK